MISILNRALSRAISGDSYYYFSRLTDEQKGIYKTILTGIESHSKDIKLPLKPVNEISKVYNSVLLDNPIIFYASSSFRQSNDLYKQKCIVIPEYKYSRSDARNYTSETIKWLSSLDAAKEKSDIDKELYVHDFCLNNFSYDYSFGDNAYSVLGLVLNKTAVCEGIAKFVKLAFDYLGVKSLIVSGNAKNPAHDAGMEGHAWNIVRINGMTYHLDVTFDMTIKGKLPRYDYFNLSDDEIKKTTL